MENLNNVTKISFLEQELAESLEEKKLLLSAHELEKSQHIEQHNRKISQLEISLSETRQSAEMASKEIQQLLNQQQMLSLRWYILYFHIKGNKRQSTSAKSMMPQFPL